MQGFFYDWPLWVLIPGLLVALLGVTEAGYRIGHRDRDRLADAAKSQVDTIEAALLGLLGLLLGFTYSMASERYDNRKCLVIAEVNAVRTTLNRARLLPADIAGPAEALIHEYVSDRIALAKSAATAHDEHDAATRKVQRQLWALLDAEADHPRRPEMTELFAEALGEMVDAKARRDSALIDHVPSSVLGLMFFSAAIVFGGVGYGFGLAGHRGFLTTSTLALLVALVILVVLDLDRPHNGLVRVGQERMIRLREGLGLAPP